VTTTPQEARAQAAGYAWGQEDASGIPTAISPLRPGERGDWTFALAYAGARAAYNENRRGMLPSVRAAYASWQATGGVSIDRDPVPARAAPARLAEAVVLDAIGAWRTQLAGAAGAAADGTVPFVELPDLIVTALRHAGLLDVLRTDGSAGDPAQAAYEAFMASAGLPVTPESFGDWRGMDAGEQANWLAAARAVAATLWSRLREQAGVRPGDDEPWDGGDVIPVLGGWLRDAAIDTAAPVEVPGD